MKNSNGSSNPGRDVVTIGASAGGLEPILDIVERLPSNLPAALFVVVHTGPETPSVLPQILSRKGRLPARHAVDGEPVQHGHIYCAPSDHHLLLGNGQVRVVQGPRENGFRPAIDPLFRSAAAYYANRVVGVVLSGALDDGVDGLMRIKQRRGVAIVQKPEEAIVDALPLNAIKYVEVDHIVAAQKIAELLIQLCGEPLTEVIAPMQHQEVIEADVVDGVTNILQSSSKQRAPSAFTCPDCGGSLWEMKNGQLVRYRCHVGHVYTGDSLMTHKDDALENVLWSALRALEESVALRTRMASRAREGNISSIAENFERRAQEDEARATLLRQLLLPHEEKKPRTAKRRTDRTRNLGGKQNGAKPSKKRKANAKTTSRTQRLSK